MAIDVVLYGLNSYDISLKLILLKLILLKLILLKLILLKLILLKLILLKLILLMVSCVFPEFLLVGEFNVSFFDKEFEIFQAQTSIFLELFTGIAVFLTNSVLISNKLQVF